MGSPEQSSEPVNSTAECTGPEVALSRIQWPPWSELKPAMGTQPMCGASGYGVEKGGPFDEPEQSEVSNDVTLRVAAPDS